MAVGAVRSRQATGRPGTPVIPAAWSQAPRTVIGKTWTSKCEIRHPGGGKGAFNQTTGTYPITKPAPHFTGKARVQVLNAQDREHLIADEPITTVAYLVAVSIDATAVKVDDVLTVTCLDANGDLTLVDHELIVKSFSRGTLAWERDLICIDRLG